MLDAAGAPFRAKLDALQHASIRTSLTASSPSRLDLYF